MSRQCHSHRLHALNEEIKKIKNKKSRFVIDFELRKCKKLRFSIFDLRRSHL